jgi:hypothetical protein
MIFLGCQIVGIDIEYKIVIQYGMKCKSTGLIASGTHLC